MLNIFTEVGQNPAALNEGERMLRIITDNSCDNFCVVVDKDMDEDELEAELRRALRHKCGTWAQYGGYEDVSPPYSTVEAEGAWEGEGWYSVKWSDGGMDWTNDGPVWFDDLDGLAAELEAAYGDATDTHLPYAEKAPDESQTTYYDVLFDNRTMFWVEGHYEYQMEHELSGGTYPIDSFPTLEEANVLFDALAEDLSCERVEAEFPPFSYVYGVVWIQCCIISREEGGYEDIEVSVVREADGMSDEAKAAKEGKWVW